MSWKRAVVATKRIEEYYLFETVANNRVYQAKLFVDKVMAMKWLQDQV